MEGGQYARHAYDAELRDLEHEMVAMASIAETMVAEATESLRRLDRNLAMEVIRKDDQIDRLDLQIEARCMRLFALQNPTGADLRLVGSMMKIITDVERVGDLAVDLAKVALKVDNEAGKSDVVDLSKIAGLSRQMFREAVQAFVRRDSSLVQSVSEVEGAVDELYRQIREQIFELMKQEPEEVVPLGWLFLAIHHLERIADHAVNIAERAEFVVTGELRQLTRPQTLPETVEQD